VETVFLVCAAVGGTILVLQFALGLLGMASDHDTDHDAGHDHWAGDHADATAWFAGLFTLRSVTAGLTFFGLSGMIALSRSADELTALAVAALGGAFALYAVAQIMHGLKRLGDDGTARIEHTVGEAGTVYVPIPGGNAGPGKVTVTVQKRTMEYAAYTAAGSLPTGARVRVVAVRGPNAVEVEPAESSQEPRPLGSGSAQPAP
jgi:membrane protein implicated in regulation of membrane protease activity